MEAKIDIVPRGRARLTPKGRQPTADDREAVRSACAGLEARRDLLIEHLHRLQDAHLCLRRGHLAALAEHLRLSQAEVYEVASFYHHFELRHDEAPAPTTIVRVCQSLSCAMGGSAGLQHDLRDALPGDVEVVSAPCIGRCHHAPAVSVGQRVIFNATLDDVYACVEAGQTEPVLPQSPNLQAYRDGGGYDVWRSCLDGTRTADQVIAELEASGMRGLGGAGFPAARKWRTVREQPAPRHMVVNIDEGEVGTFKDYHCLAQDPHRFLEGMLIAAWAVDARRIWIYLRDEYHDLRLMLTRELDALRAAFGADLPEMDLRRGAGAYICGEESAMIESIEGRRGLPRLKPPIVAHVGVFGRPTLSHNLETLWWVPEIVAKGGAAFAEAGVRGRSGWRHFSVSGRVLRPGVYRAPAGVTARELIDEYAGGMLSGHTLYAYLPGGASGGILPASLADLPLDFDTLAEHGCFVGSMAVIVLSNNDRARDAALSMMRFFEDESCGQCTPCRAGTAKAAVLMQSTQWDVPMLTDLSRVMRDASICGLGQAAPNPVDSVLRFFAHEVRA